MPVIAGEPKAKAVIQIFLSGGLTHIDTFDPKPYAPPEVRGEFRTIKSKADALRATDASYAEAYSLIDSPKAKAAFDLTKVPTNLRNRYGRTNIGQRLLMAQRLVEAGARFGDQAVNEWSASR